MNVKLCVALVCVVGAGSRPSPLRAQQHESWKQEQEAQEQARLDAAKWTLWEVRADKTTARESGLQRGACEAACERADRKDRDNAQLVEQLRTTAKDRGMDQ